MLDAHLGFSYKCFSCDITFERYLTLKAHQRDKHLTIYENDEDFDLSFQTEKELKLHVEKFKIINDQMKKSIKLDLSNDIDNLAGLIR